MSRTVSRRALLMGGAGCVISLPLFESLGRGQAVTAPPRFVAFAQPFATLGEAFWPGMPAFDFSAGQMMKYPYSGRTPLDDPNFQFSPILKPLEAWRSDLLVIEGLENAFGNHPAYASMLTGMPPINPVTGSDDDPLMGNGISIDHELAKYISKDTRYPSIQLGVFTQPGTGAHGACSWSGPLQAAPAQDVPHLVWEQLFAGISGDASQADALRQEDASVLDFALQQAGSLRTRLGQNDQQKLDQYLTSFRAVEQSISRIAAVGCQKPAEPIQCGSTPSDCVAGRRVAEGSEQTLLDIMPQLVATQFELLAMALACDLTRVASFQMAVEGNNLPFPWLGNKGAWHDLSHLAPTTGPADAVWIDWAEQYIKVSTWNIEQYALLAQRLKDFGAFDNTLVLYTQSMGNAQNHNSVNIPLLTLGNVNATFKTGRHVRVADPIADKTRKVNDLLVTILNAYDVGATTFGLPEYNQGPLGALLA
ncbi:MAG: DUF1552 domain-containing protein [Polyangiaceae bacterium]|nr:DUF1552 domain-containing protein [Polyangiaceae bacterium]